MTLSSIKTSIVLTPLLVALVGCAAETVVPNIDTENYPVCSEFNAPVAMLDSFPNTFDGTLDLATSSIAVGPSDCAEEYAPYGVESPGPDSVIGLTGLMGQQPSVVQCFIDLELEFFEIKGLQNVVIDS